jgi:RimJ/RimL family protein N-acetyltransferase
VLLTRRLALKPLSERDGSALSALAADHAVRRDLSITLLAVGAAQDRETFAIAHQERGDLIGAGGYGALTEGLASVEFALWIAAAEWGNGYGTEAAQALVDRAFANRSVSDVYASIRATNPRGRRVLEKCGFQSRGMGMARASADGGAFPVERFVLSRGAWASLKAWGAPATAGSGDGSRQTAA